MADERRTSDHGSPSGSAFPSVSYEEVDWLGDTSQVPRNRRDRYAPTYEAAVTPTIAGLEDLHVDVHVVAAADEASQEIARFDAELGGELAPFAAVLLRSESAASSQIENLTASARSIGLAELAETNRQNASLIVANVRTMQAALELADRLDETTIIEMHRQLLGASDPRIVGSWREQQVWIGGSRWGPQEATYVAPHHERVESAMADLVAFMDRDDLPVLIQTAVAHAQFETIHPFPDGNGRTGRALVHSMLRAKGVTRSVTVPISAGLLADTDGYFEALTAYRQGDPNPIVSAMADAAFAATVNGRRLRDELDEVRASWKERISARRDAAVWRIADHLLSQPVVTAQVLQTAIGASAPAVNAALDQLGSVEIVSNLTGKSRNRVWVADDVIAALDAFAERSGRRG